MLLKSLRLTNFRNFSELDLDFSRATLVIGDNSQGKSNLLEAIYFLATTKSPRAERDEQLIKKGEGFCRVEGEVSTNGDKKDASLTGLEIVMQKRGDGEPLSTVEKRVKINGVSRRVIDYIGNLAVIYFSPEDINLVTGPPALRRWHIDLTLAQVDREYKTSLTNYTAALASRNRVLKRIREGLGKADELTFWTEQILTAGKTISQKRRDFFRFLNEQVSTPGALNGSLGRFCFVYLENVISEERIRGYQDREIAAAASLIGPHRDDFIFELDGQNMAHFSSRGEQRTAALDLKLAELRFVSSVKNTQPVLLLDDVFSELDAKHRDYVISVIGSQQTVLSAIETESIPKKFLAAVDVVRIKDGVTFPSFVSGNALPGVIVGR